MASTSRSQDLSVDAPSTNGRHPPSSTATDGPLCRQVAPTRPILPSRDHWLAPPAAPRPATPLWASRTSPSHRIQGLLWTLDAPSAAFPDLPPPTCYDFTSSPDVDERTDHGIAVDHQQQQSVSPWWSNNTSTPWSSTTATTNGGCSVHLPYLFFDAL